MSTVRVRRCSVCKLSGHNSRTCPQVGRETALAPVAPAAPIKKPNLGLLSIGAKQIFVSLLPSQAESVIVKYQPDIQVSCVIPPLEFPIKYAHSRRTSLKKTLTITTPTLIMSCGYGDIPMPRNYKRLIRPYTLWAIDTHRKSKIYGKPYLFANVYDSGSICFGTLNPASLRQAYNYYWTSSFNAELYRINREIIHTCNNKTHDFVYHTGHKCDPTKKRHTCACPRVTFHQHYGCGCTTVGESKACRGACGRSPAQTSQEYDLDQAGRTSRRRGRSQTSACDCCQAIQAVQAEARLVDPNIGQRKLNKLAIIAEGTDYPGCGCNYRHKRGCQCKNLRCACQCFCICCTVECGHGVCLCSCCQKTCRCRCNCSAESKFTCHLKDYHEKLMPKQKWKDRTSLFCGTKFWAAPKAGAGVIMSNDKVLLRQIPKKFWRKDKNGHALLISLANKKSEGGWFFESGGFTFELSDANVIAR